MNIEEAIKLAMQTDYALIAIEEPLPINEWDAGNFFLAGYEYAKKQEINK